MELWNSVCKTDPKHTKKVNQRGGFTAIDAHYQVQQATEAFGPVGIGWGYSCEYQFQNAAVICLLTFWHGSKSQSFGPIAGCSTFVSTDRNGSSRMDTDAPKKAMTDALTKALSHLGFNADVFLGKFDDNKYVQQMAQEFAPAAPTQPAPAQSPELSDAKKAACARVLEMDLPEMAENFRKALEYYKIQPAHFLAAAKVNAITDLPQAQLTSSFLALVKEPAQFAQKVQSVVGSANPKPTTRA